ncbi:MAG: gamma-glutamyltransferase [Candidatus Rokuibacteriota bacterium]
MCETRWPAARGRRVVATPHPLATMAGLHVLLRGGTAIDAAVAAGTTLAVVYPHMTGGVERHGGARAGDLARPRGGDPRADGPALGA